MKSNFVAVAGTFDHLHAGHEKLLATAQKTGQPLVIGLCQSAMLKDKKFPQSLESYPIRRQNLARFKPEKIVPLTDIYGTAINDPAICTIVCSSLTRPNVDKINRKRHLNNLNYLSVIEVPLILAQDGKPISSTRIRSGEINRQGLVYKNLLAKKLTLVPANRHYFQTPFGKVGKTPKKKPEFITACVGDFACLSLTKQKIFPDLAIVDLQVNRRPFVSNLLELKLKPGLTAVNPAGTVTPNLAEKISACLKQKIPTILVKGEEDLAVLPLVLLAPLNSLIYYGQPNQGIVKVVVTEKAKQAAVKFLNYFQ